MGGHHAVTDGSASIDQLMARAAAGGAKAPESFSELYKRLHPVVHNWVRQYVRDPHISEDLAQEVWIKVAQNLARYQPGTKPMAWLATITRNTAVDYLRKEQRRPTEVLQADDLALDRPRQGASVSQQVEQRQLAQAVAHAMNALKPDQRKCLQLRFFDGISPAHTAQVMGKTESAVRTLQHRSLKRLARVFPQGESSADLVEVLLTIAAHRGRVVGVRVEDVQEQERERAHHVRTR
ncbi:RNA polymerase sigma factor [Streptomyces sp. NPDC051362]|uniref:RNA polymerase sigma factor n=1 Tax=Streptomyces sp. NPDC051362 TaxID=3365651 RepID=UPI0037B4E1D9